MVDDFPGGHKFESEWEERECGVGEEAGGAGFEAPVAAEEWGDVCLCEGVGGGGGVGL